MGINGDSGYSGSNGHTVTGADKPGPPALAWWMLPVVVWRPIR